MTPRRYAHDSMSSVPSTDPGTPSLPTGTVTFLFTDIEGSTRLWESQPAAMQAALARHDALVRECVAGRGGHIYERGRPDQLAEHDPNYALSAVGKALDKRHLSLYNHFTTIRRVGRD
jgi:class 3 adenylate cyclase